MDEIGAGPRKMANWSGGLCPAVGGYGLMMTACKFFLYSLQFKEKVQNFLR